MAFSADSLIERYARFAERRGIVVIGAAVAIGILGYFGALRLEVDTRLEALLPAATPSLRSLDTLRERVASDAPLTLLVASDDPALNQRLVATLRERVAGWEETRWAIDRRDPSFFLERRLLYLPAADLESLADDVEARVEWEECNATPGCLSLEDQPSLPSAEELATLFRSQPAVRMLARFVGAEENDARLDASARPSPEASQEAPRDATRVAPVGSLCNDDATVCALQASIRGDAGDVQWATQILRRSEALLEEVRPEEPPPSLRMAVSGRYRNGPMTKRAVEEDLQSTTLLSSGLVLLLVLFQFRGPRALVLLVFPIVVALLATLGLLGLIHPRLNLISAFTLAILAGIGIDFGLHLLTHYGALRLEGRRTRVAVASSMKSLGASLLAAGATTGCAFGALAAADFRGFAEMGGMAALGVGLSLVSFLVLFGPLVFAMDRVLREQGPILRRTPLDDAPPPRQGLAAAVTIAGLALAVLGAGFGTGVSFEYDFRNLRPAKVAHGIPTSESLHGTTGAAVYLLGESPASIANLTRALREDEAAQGGLLLTPSLLVPPEQGVRLATIARMRDAVARIAGGLEGEAAAKVEAIRPWLQVRAPITAEKLPAWVADAFVERDGTTGRMAVLHLPLRGSDAHAMEALAGTLERWRAEHADVVFASPEAVVGEIVPGLREDAPRILGLALLGLTIATLLFGRSLVRTLLVLAPVMLFMSISFGLMALLDLRLNFYNMLVLPVAFGVGVDGAVYVVWAMSRRKGETSSFAVRWGRLTTSARAIVGSTATTLAAFGSITVASNPGLASLGTLALVTVGLSLFANVLWLPALLAWWQRRGGDA